MCLLILAASQHEIPFLRTSMFKYLTFETSIRAEFPVRLLPFLQLVPTFYFSLPICCSLWPRKRRKSKSKLDPTTNIAVPCRKMALMHWSFTCHITRVERIPQDEATCVQHPIIDQFESPSIFHSHQERRTFCPPQQTSFTKVKRPCL